MERGFLGLEWGEKESAPAEKDLDQAGSGTRTMNGKEEGHGRRGRSHIPGSKFGASGRRDHYAAWNPDSRTSSSIGTRSGGDWFKVPVIDTVKWTARDADGNLREPDANSTDGELLMQSSDSDMAGANRQGTTSCICSTRGATPPRTAGNPRWLRGFRKDDSSAKAEDRFANYHPPTISASVDGTLDLKGVRLGFAGSRRRSTC